MIYKKTFRLMNEAGEGGDAGGGGGTAAVDAVAAGNVAQPSLYWLLVRLLLKQSR